MKKISWKNSDSSKDQKSPLLAILNASLLSSLISSISFTFIWIIYGAKETGTILDGTAIFFGMAIGVISMFFGFVITLPLLLVAYFVIRGFLRKGKKTTVLLGFMFPYYHASVCEFTTHIKNKD